MAHFTFLLGMLRGIVLTLVGSDLLYTAVRVESQKRGTEMNAV